MKARLEMTTRIIDPEGNEQFSEANSDCEYNFFCGCAKITYDERGEDGITGVLMELAPRGAKIERRGFLRYRIELVDGIKTEADIHTPYGAMPASARLNSYHRRLSERGGEFRFEYSFAIDDNLSKNEVVGKVVVY